MDLDLKQSGLFRWLVSTREFNWVQNLDVMSLNYG